jgi:SNF2 family DNA or RNA helicase
VHILHGTWLSTEQVFALWGEDTISPPQYKKGRRGPVAPHPFRLQHEVWLQYLVRYMTDPQPDALSIQMWLPGKGKKVQPSPEAINTGLLPLDSDLELLAWQVSAITLHPIDTLDLLLQLPETGQASMQLGSDLQFWQQMALMATNGLVEGRFVPALSQQGRQYRAFWQAKPDATLLQQMAHHMPIVARAVTDNPENVPPASDTIRNFLSTMTDAFVREQHQSTRLPVHPWLRALTGKDTLLKGSQAENKKLYEAWETWVASGDDALGAFRISFRLQEPKTERGKWTLDYLLQATDDPSLIVEAKLIWSTKTSFFEYLEHRLDHPQDKLLRGLGLAARIFKPIEKSLRTARPTQAKLSREEAFLFLTEAVALLESSGFGVLVPNWWGKHARLKAKAHIKGQSNEPTGFLTKDTLLRYEWQMSIGENAISREEFEALVALKQPLVRYKGEWVALDPEQIESALKFFNQTEADQELTLFDALRMQSPDLADDGIEVEETEIVGWLADMFAKLQNPDGTVIPDQPTDLIATLRPYQARGFGWLTQMRQMGLGACLADDMGLGKTVQTITLWLHEREQLHVENPALLVCPTSVVGNWRHELRRFAPSLNVMNHQGSERITDREAFKKAASDVDVILTSYAVMRRDVEMLKEIHWSDIVLDEAQNIKNPSTKQAQAARAIPADFKLALTGTPVENRLLELWSIMQFLNTGYLGAQKTFKSNFATPIERYKDENAAASLKQLTAPFILRRLKTDASIIQDLPDKFENKVYCTLSPEQATLYEAEVRESLEAIDSADDEMARRGNVLGMLTRLKQVCNHPAHFLKEGTTTTLDNRSGKLNRLNDMLEVIREQDERALIFTQYAEMGKLLQGYLREKLMDDVLFLHGGTPAKKRDEMVRRFQSAQGPPVFILSLKAGGTGLTLTSANHVFHYDRWYNPAVENQATDRAYRIGQTKDVQVHKYICLGTLEEQIDAMIDHKKSLADAVVGAGESWISEMNTDELRDLVSLRQDTTEVYE